MLKTFLNFLYPPECAICGCLQQLDTVRRVCGTCLASLERITEPFCSRCGVPLAIGADDETGACQRCRLSPPRFTAARSVLRYHPSSDLQHGTLGSMVRRLKYGLDRSLAPALDELIADRLPFPAGFHDIVVSVPLHKSRLRWRGFNQAALLGAAVARRAGCTFDPTMLARVRPTPPQTTLNHRLRARNVQGAFVFSGSRPVSNRRILLVDDVMTTGATADECARALIDAGAASVDVFTLARVL